MSSQECFQLRDTGSCPYGANCRFLHPTEETRGSRRRAEQICYPFRDTGACQYGDNCRFSHDASLKDKPAPAPAAAAAAPAAAGDRPARTRAPRKPREQKEAATGPKPADAGRLECYTFKSTGSCNYGDNCRFLHGDAPTRGSRRRDVQVCYIFRDTGRCEFGDDCRFSHKLDEAAPAPAAGGAGKPRGPRKENTGAKPKRVCRDFVANGDCKFGDSCRFSHETAVDQE